MTARRRAHDLGTATGLGRFGAVRLLDAPHTEENFVMREMGYRIARKHAAKLRRLAVAGAVRRARGVVVRLATALAPASPLGRTALALLASLSAAAGLGVERWLFFAEATHVSMLYYGRAA